MFDKEELKRIKNEQDVYESSVEKVLAKRPETKEDFLTSGGISLKRTYSPIDLEPIDYCDEIGFPGQYPFTRGVRPTMYRGRFWTMRQYAGFATAEESNRRYRYLLSQGTTGLSVAFDLPTQIGYDSDDPMALGECGKVGVAIDTLSDFETLFDKIPLDKVSTSMTINSPAAILLSMYIAVAEKQGVSADSLSGTIQNDILKEFIARGTYIFPPRPSMRLVTDIFKFCSDNIPKWNTISISGYHIREAGSTAVQEVAFTLADGIAYIEAAIKSGQDPNVFGKRLSFFFNAHNDFLEEIAKYRAARKVWSSIMKDRFGVTDKGAQTLRFHTQTAGCTLTALQAENNIVRTTIQCMAAVLGGTQSLHTNSLDEALALPSDKAAQIALRTQQIVAHESGITNVVDPLAGSYALESLTKQIEEEVWKYIKKIDDLGGMIEAIELGFPQREIQEAAYSYQKSIENEETIIVGVNKYYSEDDVYDGQLLKVDEEVGKKQIKKLQQIKSSRDNLRVRDTLSDIRKAAEGDENLLPLMLNSVRSYATVGEICSVLREVFGEHKENVIL
ncbi:MAG: methylmalonyl-CoA mutase family protein [Synergistaceae bacterium]|nr:methylmalonyl-CoA mutase family protein [Synergistaceae bacterium]